MLDLAREYVPAPQPLQVNTDVAPGSGEKVPATQLAHSDEPGASWYAPAAHNAQTVAPAAENCPSPQAAQEADDAALTASECLPAAHSTQVRPRVNWPEGHGEAEQAAEPADANVLKKQAEQAGAPDPAAYVFGAHGEQRLAPASLNDPAPHSPDVAAKPTLPQ